jgi:stalled ribosome alternative rescue factor ArfA
MRKRPKKKPRKINPIARSLRSGALQRRVEKPKKGKGSYTRKKTSLRDEL